jgi:hypothetical protein
VFSIGKYDFQKKTIGTSYFEGESNAVFRTTEAEAMVAAAPPLRRISC